MSATDTEPPIGSEVDAALTSNEADRLRCERSCGGKTQPPIGGAAGSFNMYFK